MQYGPLHSAPDRTALFGPWLVEKFGLVAISLAIIGCQQSPRSGSVDDQALRIGGSTTLFPALTSGFATYRETIGAVDFELTQSSSGNGIIRLINGELDIAAASRSPTPREFKLARENSVALKTYQIAIDGVALIVHPEKARTVSTMNLAQTRAIFFSGEIHDWSQLDSRLLGPITIYTRDARSSGTATAFVEIIAGNHAIPFVAGSRPIERTDLVIPTVGHDRNGIGFTSLSQLDNRVAAIAFGFEEQNIVQPSAANVRNMQYQLRRDLFLISNGTPRGQVNDYIRFMLSAHGQKVLEQHDMTSIY